MRKHYVYLLGFFFTLLVSSAPAQDIYFKADDLMRGIGSRPYDDYTQITSVQFGAHAEVSYIKGTTTPGRPEFSEIVLTKRVDASTSKLMLKLAQGKLIKDVEIINVVNSRETGEPSVVHKIELKDVFVSDFSTSNVNGCEDGCPSLAESIHLAFRSIRITTYSQDSRGVYTANTPFSWDVITNSTTF